MRVLADAVGSMFASTELVRVIVDAGGLFSFYRPPGLRLAPSSWHRRDHRKIVVIDGRIGFVGGSNLCDEHLPPTSGGAPWRDTNLRIEGEFKVYAPLVPVDSYVIVENTIVNGHPVWPGFGPGPLEAVKRILSQHGEFVADTTMEKYGLTFNPNGFLKRTR